MPLAGPGCSLLGSENHDVLLGIGSQALNMLLLKLSTWVCFHAFDYNLQHQRVSKAHHSASFTTREITGLYLEFIGFRFHLG